jgi:hypothetical protein
MVIFQSAEGTPGYHQTDGLEDAVRFVEGPRNDQDVDHARIFRMEEVPFEFRPYFRVELGKANGALRVRGFSLGESESIDLTEVPLDGEDVEVEVEVESSDAEVPGALTDDPVTDFERDGEGDPVTSGAVARRGLFGR